jgi:tetratricopeptide (TPR) repeat protein
LARNPRDPDALVWVGRRLGYLGRFRDAVATFTRGVKQHPDDARFLRHRGHRYITLRQFDRAIADLERASRLMLAAPDAIEPDGQPNARGVPTGTLYFNVYYHLALARYLARDFAGSATAWADCQTVSKSPDKLVATSYWHYLTLRRLGREDDARALLAPIRADLDVIENRAYHQLLLAFASDTASEALLLGAKDNDLATLGNGVATWFFVSGHRQQARSLWQRVVETTPWPAFGHLAAEVELAQRG